MASKKVIEYHRWLRAAMRESRRRARENYDWRLINEGDCYGNAYLNAARTLEELFPELKPKTKARKVPR